MKVTALPNQSVIDIAVQCTSTADSALEIARANDVVIDHTYSSPTEVVVPDSLWNPLNIVPCTGDLSLNAP